MKKLNLILVVAFLAVFTACQNGTETKNSTEGTTAETLSETHAESPEEIGKTYELGDQVPHDMVCMVNDAYMGRLQMEVPFEGKMYYGCCEMCVKRIPNDPAVRTAVDPFSSEEVDKAESYIVLAGPNGEVMYFENEENYQEFLSSRENS